LDDLQPAFGDEQFFFEKEYPLKREAIVLSNSSNGQRAEAV
jgi:hypothetical protein